MDVSSGIHSISKAMDIYFVLFCFKGRQMATGHLGQIIDVSPNVTSMCYLVDKPKIGSFQGLRSLGPKVNMV